jgi:hypothetical protein
MYTIDAHLDTSGVCGRKECSKEVSPCLHIILRVTNREIFACREHVDDVIWALKESLHRMKQNATLIESALKHLGIEKPNDVDINKQIEDATEAALFVCESFKTGAVEVSEEVH